MRFERLSLTGFKSFSETQEVELRPGLTGLVGPNGCGKSNVLEGLRWVMGASSAKALRAGGMEDVIFAGSGTKTRPGRPARQWAEVTLTLDNEARDAPKAWPEEWSGQARIEVTRRITKRADGSASTFRVNGREVRAKDVQLLFADAASGAGSAGLVRQGQVSELIAAKPQNRRRLLEEAAGITGLHARRHEAELRLQATLGNLERLDDVIGELETQRATLARQARQATRYRNIAAQLRRVEALLAYARWHEADESYRTASHAFEAAEARVLEASEAAAAAASTLARLRQAAEPQQVRAAEAAAALGRLQTDRDGLAAEIARAESVVARLEGAGERLASDLDREAGLAREADEALASLAEEEAALRAGAAADEPALLQAELNTKATSRTLDDAERAFDVARAEAAEADAERRAATAALSSAETRADRLTSELEAATTALAGLGEGGAETEKLTRLRDQAASLLAEAERALSSAESDKAAAAAAIEPARRPLEDATGRVKEVEAEAAALRRLLDRSAPEPGAALDQVEADGGYEVALAAALGDDLSASMGSESGAEEASRRWTGKAGEASAELPVGAEPMTKIIRAPAALARRLAAIGVVRREDGAALSEQLRPGQRLVSREGDLWRWDGFFAAAGAPTQAAIRLEQRRRLAELEEAGGEARRGLNGMQTAFASAKQVEEAAGSRLREAQRQVRDARASAVKADRALSEAVAEDARAAAKREAATARVTAAETALGEAETERDDAARRVAGLAEANDARAVLDPLRADLAAAREAHDEARAAVAATRRDRDQRAERLRVIASDVEAWRTRRETAQDRLASVREVAADTAEQLDAARPVPDRLRTRQAAMADELAAAESRLRAARAEAADTASRLSTGEVAAHEAGEAQAQAREHRARLAAETDAARRRVAEAVAAAAQVQEGPPSSLLTLAEHDEDAPLPAAEALETKIAKLRREREALGAVNLVADREAAELEERVRTIEAERADCEAAVAKLRGAIGALNRDGRQKLLAAFEVVNEHFSSLFVRLFGGGEARLELTESEDPLEAGLEVMASPPGKKLSSLSLMSGGEQALTATALIFAVFRANPAPVCVLDEVDAPLDDANVDRFCGMLRQMAEETDTRFMVITHHALTMSRMDRLYGVTMIEHGISRVVSVDLSEAQDMAA